MSTLRHILIGPTVPAPPSALRVRPALAPSRIATWPPCWPTTRPRPRRRRHPPRQPGCGRRRGRRGSGGAESPLALLWKQGELTSVAAVCCAEARAAPCVAWTVARPLARPGMQAAAPETAADVVLRRPPRLSRSGGVRRDVGHHSLDQGTPSGGGARAPPARGQTTVWSFRHKSQELNVQSLDNMRRCCWARISKFTHLNLSLKTDGAAV
jgi:hypothetical protein